MAIVLFLLLGTKSTGAHARLVHEIRVRIAFPHRRPVLAFGVWAGVDACLALIHRAICGAHLTAETASRLHVDCVLLAFPLARPFCTRWVLVIATLFHAEKHHELVYTLQRAKSRQVHAVCLLAIFVQQDQIWIVMVNVIDFEVRVSRCMASVFYEGPDLWEVVQSSARACADLCCGNALLLIIAYHRLVKYLATYVDIASCILQAQKS